jgi:uncharacterized protein (TIGR02231 family)
MRTSLSILFGLLTPLAAHAVDVAQPVTRVVVYPDSALVTRAMDVACGGSDIVSTRFSHLVPTLDPNSVRASVIGTHAKIEGVSVNTQILEKPFAADVDALDKQIEDLQDRQTALQRQIERAQANHERATSMQNTIIPFINREAATQPKPNTAAWASALDQTKAAIEESNALRRAAQIEQRDVQRKLADLMQRKQALAGAVPPRAFVADVVLHCDGAKARVELSYMTSAASWAPAYEARADESAHSIELSVLANVTQQTGENWNNVDVTLSTAMARRNAEPPKMLQLYVGQQPKVETQKTLVRRDEVANHLAATGATAEGGEDVGTTDEGLSVQLRVPGKADIIGDGRPAQLLVQKLPLDAEFALATTPKLLPYVLDRGEAKNTAKYPLLPGPISLFTRGAFLGTTQLERIAEGDKIKLAFGLNENVQVRRITLSEEKKEPGLLGSTRRLTYAYRIEVTSSASKPTTVEVQEQIPVSEMDDVKVLIDKETTPGFKTAALDGLLTWPVTLAAGEKKTLEVHFTIEIPSKYDSGGL